MDTSNLTEQQLREYAANYMVLRRVACEAEVDRKLEQAMELACGQVLPDDHATPTTGQFDQVMARLRNILAAAEG